ncbi:alpha/beta hydrolase family protein [Nocardia sp. NPDC051052]|uniref:alpha/beta hydrolase family protein n=1 Tax=Nocardia sp. NPDC051052 TaxID=3364322 RepID=UPI0037A10E00
MMKLPRRLVVTACALTGTTEWVVRRSGARYFLPEVLVPRFANLAGVDRAVFAAQLAGARSFADERWAGYWERIAAAHMAAADGALAALAARPPTLGGLLDIDRASQVLGPLLAPAAAFLADRGPQAGPDDVANFRRIHAGAGELEEGQSAAAVIAIDAIVKAMAYYLVACWPGRSPARMRAYAISQQLARLLVAALAPGLGLAFESMEIPVGGEIVRASAVFPSGEHRCATMLATNGLDGTMQELLLPLLKYCGADLGVVVMEMPGTYSYSEPMSVESERVYRAVIDHLRSHPRVDGGRIGMFGMSFGGYWSARMAAVDRRLRCAIAAGTPTHRSFGPTGLVGAPAVMVDAMRQVVGAGSTLGIGRKLPALSLRRFYSRIAIPLFVVNGAADTLVDPHDSVELAAAAPHGILRLYAGDDHCAISHYADWLDVAMAWARRRLDVDHSRYAQPVEGHAADEGRVLFRAQISAGEAAQ